ncbi:MAG: hypothetical protein HRT70_01265 [Flavobacteriaceae bacterium]|nr:hypothetical protein [Flavobacteriaceae bacterium]
MEYGTAVEYYKAIDVIEAQEALLDLRIVTYPHAKQENQREIRRGFEKKAYPEGFRKEMDFVEFFKRMGHG